MRINKISITLFSFLLIMLFFVKATNGSEQIQYSVIQKTNLAKSIERKKKNISSETKKKNITTHNFYTTSSKASQPFSRSARQTLRTRSFVLKEKSKRTVLHKGYKSTAYTRKTKKLSDLHKIRIQQAQKTAMNKLMKQIGKPYRWGGSSPRTGFDCSGLVYYAYKDLVKFRIPRTANEMYHLRDASPVNRSELKSGDLVFFRIQGRGTADHVGVYLGNGKFIQSPRSGQDIRITSMSKDYWIRHYVGARRMMTPKTIR